jgi:RimJ/RimL family protein N-acetyltransferase
MNDSRDELSIRFRDFRPEDIPALVKASNQTYPDEPTTEEQEAHWDRIFPQGNPRRRIVAETTTEEFVGLGDCLRPYWLNAPGVYVIFILIAPEWRRRGVGQSLLQDLEAYARGQGVERLHTDCREDFADAARFLKRAGYTNIGIRFESRLDLNTFDETGFAGVFDRLASTGYVFTTLAAEREIEPAADRKLYDLYQRVVAEVPLPGGVHIDQTYENWRAAMLEGPTCDPTGIFIARAGGQYAGMTSLELLQDGPAITSMTGVTPEHRGRSLALALKLLSFRFLKEHGYTEARTHNDTANPPILRLNEKLGYQRLPGWLVWEKSFTTAEPG